jgi:hypothetical protein
MSRSSWHRSGMWLVAAMFGFGLVLTATLFVYSWLHTAPFRAIAASIAAEYPGSAPRVEGGKPRLDLPGEVTLRITMQAPFDPNDERRANEFARDVANHIAGRHALDSYDVVEVHLFHGEQADAVPQRSVRMNVKELQPASTDAVNG